MEEGERRRGRGSKSKEVLDYSKGTSHQTTTSLRGIKGKRRRLIYQTWARQQRQGNSLDEKVHGKIKGIKKEEKGQATSKASVTKT